MNSNAPNSEYIPSISSGIHYLEHGWPSDLIRWHAHHPFELHLMVKTHGKVFVGDYIGHYGPGQLILTGPLVPHNWVTNKDELGPIDLRDMVVQFTLESMEKLVEGFSETKKLMALLEMSRSGIEFVGYDMDKAINQLNKIRNSRGTERLIAFLSMMVDLESWPNIRVLSTARIVSPLSRTAENSINNVVQYIADNSHEHLSLGKVAAMVNMSENAFSRHFSKATGNKFVEFVNRIRIGRACIKLVETNQRVSAICFDVGFNNITNFNRHFYKIKGKTPSEYRRVVRVNLGKGKWPVTPTIATP
jgi:AraC-like DNA-binding protein